MVVIAVLVAVGGRGGVELIKAEDTGRKADLWRLMEQDTEKI